MSCVKSKLLISLLLVACCLGPLLGSSFAAAGESESDNIAVRIEGGRLWIDVEHERLGDVLYRVAKCGDIDLELHGEFSRRVSFAAQGESVEVALQWLLVDEITVMEFEPRTEKENVPRLIRLRVYANSSPGERSGSVNRLTRMELLRERLVKDGSPHLKFRAINELAEIGTKEAIDVLRETMVGQNPELRAQIIDAFFRIGGLEGVRALGDSLSEEVDPELRAQALEGLRFLGTAEAMEVLEAARYDSRDDVRSGAASALDDLAL